MNCLAAIKISEMMGKSKSFALSQLQTYRPLRHRMEFVATINGIDFYNDSKSTNPDSTLKAIESFDIAPILILCGEDKGVDLFPMLQECCSKVAMILVFGDISDNVCRLVSEYNLDIKIRSFTYLNEVISYVMQDCRSGDIVLFSPSSSSYDQFNGFEDRGDQFCEQLNNYDLSTYQTS